MRKPDPNSATKNRLGYHFQQLVNAIQDVNLPPEHLEVVELIVAAKQRCWEVIDGKPPGRGLTRR